MHRSTCQPREGQPSIFLSKFGFGTIVGSVRAAGPLKSAVIRWRNAEAVSAHLVQCLGRCRGRPGPGRSSAGGKAGPAGRECLAAEVGQSGVVGVPGRERHALHLDPGRGDRCGGFRAGGVAESLFGRHPHRVRDKSGGLDDVVRRPFVSGFLVIHPLGGHLDGEHEAGLAGVFCVGAIAVAGRELVVVEAVIAGGQRLLLVDRIDQDLGRVEIEEAVLGGRVSRDLHLSDPAGLAGAQLVAGQPGPPYTSEIILAVSYDRRSPPSR